MNHYFFIIAGTAIAVFAAFQLETILSVFGV